MKENTDNTIPFDELAALRELESLRRTKGEYEYKRRRDEIAKDAPAGFKSREQAYQKDAAKIKQLSKHNACNLTDFSGQPFALLCGEWDANDEGITRLDESSGGVPAEIEACAHPILPVERVIDIETNQEQVKLGYTRDRNHWKYITVKKSTAANKQAIIALADFGISVSSITAGALVEYLQAVDSYNYSDIPEVRGVSHLGWVEGYGFAPYCIEELAFTCGELDKKICDSVECAGDMAEWIINTDDLRRYSPEVNIALAASFASPLMPLLNIMPFVVNFWSEKSGIGKTVACEIAASVWAKPKAYITSMNHTANAIEKRAGILRNLPLILDELQTASKGFDVYRFCEGQSRGRLNQSAELRELSSWSSCAITNGESPLVSDSAAAGAQNRVLDVECRKKLVPDGNKTVTFLAANHGFAGWWFVKQIQEPGVFDSIRTQFNLNYREIISSCPTTSEKQAQIVAALQTANQLADSYVFKSRCPLLMDLMLEIMRDEKTEISTGARGYRDACEWVVQNRAHFEPESLSIAGSSPSKAEIYGRLSRTSDVEGDGYVYIIRRVWMDKIAAECKFSAKAVLRWMSENGVLVKNPTDRAFTKRKRIYDGYVECICMRLPLQGEE